MAYIGTIKVETSKLVTTANQFDTSAGNVNRITSEMLTCVYDTCGHVWKGTAANRYRSKMDTLRDDMRRMYNMFREHCEDLKAMAKNYETAEQTNVSKFNTLQENPVQ